MIIETLNDSGFSYEQVGIKAARLVADYGEGYTQAARIGHAEGLKAWRFKIDALPDLPQYKIIIETRARYLWNFWVRHKLQNETEIFRLRDPFARDAGRPYAFARFADEELTYEVLFTECVFRTGLTLIEARIPYMEASDYNSQQI